MAYIDNPNKSVDSIFNIQYKRKMVLMAIDFSFYNEIIDSEIFDSAVFFNKFFPIIKKIIEKFGGAIENINGDSCFVSFGQYCDINPEFIACKCAKLIIDTINKNFKDVFRQKEVYIYIAIHSDEVYASTLKNNGSNQRYITGHAVAVLQNILNYSEKDQINISESVYKNVKTYCEVKQIGSVPLNNSQKINIYQIDKFLNLDITDIHVPYPDLNDKISGISDFINKKMQISRTMIYQRDISNDRDFLFAQFFEENKHSYLFFHSSINKYNSNYVYSYLRDFYLILQRLMFLEEFENDEDLKKYNQFLREYFSFNPVYYSTNVNFKATVYTFIMIFKKLSQKKKVVIFIDDIDNLDDESSALLNNLILALRQTEVYFIITTQKDVLQIDNHLSFSFPYNGYNMFETREYVEYLYNKKTKELSQDFVHFVFDLTEGNVQKIEELMFYINKRNYLDDDKKEYLNAPRDIYSLVLSHFKEMNENQLKIAKILSCLSSNVSLDFLQNTLPDIDVLAELKNMSENKLVKIDLKVNKILVSLAKKNYAQILSDMISKEEYCDIHKQIARAYQVCYAHCLPNYYQRLAYHYEQANMTDEAIYYIFASAMNYREQCNNEMCRQLLLHAIHLGDSVQENYSNFHSFTQNEIEYLDYQSYKKFFKYKCKTQVSLDLLYYFYAKTFSLHEEEAILYLKKSYDYAKKYNRDFLIILSSLHYFIYNCYNHKVANFEYLEEAYKIAEKYNDGFMKAFINMSYMEMLFAECVSNQMSEAEVLDTFFEAKSNLNSALAIFEDSRNALNVFFYSTYAYYLKRTRANVKKIISAIKNAESYLLSDPDRLEFYDSIASGIGPLVGTAYQLDYTKKSLNIALHHNHLPQIAQYKATIGYLYMLAGKYEKALVYHNSAKSISESTNNLRETHMSYKNLGDLYNCLTNYKEAEVCFRKCLETPIDFDESRKVYIDFSDPIFAKSGLAFTSIKLGKLDEARKLIKDIATCISNIFFGSEIPIFLTFLKCYLSLIDKEYDDETIKVMKNCYLDMKRIMPNAVQLVWIKRELKENGIDVGE